MTNLWQRLKQRKLVQWAVAYLAGAWALLQVLDLAADSYDWPSVVIRVAFALVALGFVVTLVLAWYHGERGEQKVTSVELMILAAVLAVGGGLLWRYAQVTSDDANVPQPLAGGATRASAAAADIPFKSIAVLPFVNMSADPTQEYFSDGIAEELLNRLAQLPDLKVAARTSAFQFKGKNEDIGDIGQQLKVAHVLEGSVRKSGNTLRITAQLIDSRSGYHLWSETYDRDASDIFKVQDEIAGAIATTLEARLGGTPLATASTRQAIPAAYDAYLQGRAFAAKRRDELNNAITAFDRAIAIDPDYSAAYSGKAFSIMLRPLWNIEATTRAVLDEARRSADIALRLDPQNAEAYMVRGMVAFFGHDPVAAAADMDRALALAPGNADILNLDGDFRTYTGDLAAAERGKRKAMALDPLSFVHPMNLSDVLQAQGRFAEAVIAAQQAIALGAGEYGYDRLFLSYLGAGRLDRAEEAMRKSCALNRTGTGVCRFDRLQLFAARGERAQARALLDPMMEKLQSGDYNSYSGPGAIALYYVQLHDIPRATAAQRLALDQDDWYPTTVLVLAPGGARLPEEISTDPQWLAVWNDPRMKPMTDVYRRNLLAWRAQEKPQ